MSLRIAGFLRSTVERLSRGWSFERRLPAEFGRRIIRVSADARLSFLKFGDSAFDSELLSYVTEHIRPGDVVWDIGANVGEFAMAAAHQVGSQGQVLAIEPDLWLANLMYRSTLAAANSDLQIRILCTAVADREGLAKFRIAERGRAANSLVGVQCSSQAGGMRKLNLVPVISLDKILESETAPNLVKIDVEGAEALVLLGAKILLKSVRPKLIVEVTDRGEQVTQILKQAGYRLFSASKGEQAGEVGACTYNTLAIPE